MPDVLELILIGAGAMVVGGYVAYRVGRARGRARALPAPARQGQLERTLKDVRVDDVVQHAGRDWLVEGTVEYEEDGHRWRGARIVDSPDERWCVIGLERQSDATVRFLSVAKDLELTGYPPEQIDHGGTSYKLGQRGTATTQVAGALGDIPLAKVAGTGKVARCRWWRYEAIGDKTMIVEQWGDVYRTLVGSMVPKGDVDLLAGS